MSPRHDIVRHDFIATGVEMPKEAGCTLADALLIVEGHPIDPLPFQSELIELANVGQALASGVPCQLTRHQAVVAIGGHKGFGFPTVHIAPINLMSLKKAEEVVQCAASTRPRLLEPISPRSR